MPLSHTWLTSAVMAGDTVVDATCGNGHDTLLLAELVGKTGKVWAFDIQQEALGKTSSLLEHAGFAERTQLIHCGHEHLSEHLKVPVSAVVFNLGYLPGGDRKIATATDTTIRGLDQATRLLKPGGIVAITVYPGHDTGATEAAAVTDWAVSINPRQFYPWIMRQINVPENAPYFILVQKAP